MSGRSRDRRAHRQLPVIRQSPPWRACRIVRPRNVDAPARSSNPPTAASRGPRPSQRRTRTPPRPGPTSHRRCRPRTIDDAASTPSATVRNRLAGPAMGYPCGTATRCLPVSDDGHRICCPACPHRMASPIRQPPGSSEITPIRVTGQSSLVNAFPFGRHALDATREDPLGRNAADV